MGKNQLCKTKKMKKQEREPTKKKKTFGEKDKNRRKSHKSHRVAKITKNFDFLLFFGQKYLLPFLPLDTLIDAWLSPTKQKTFLTHIFKIISYEKKKIITVRVFNYLLFQFLILTLTVFHKKKNENRMRNVYWFLQPCFTRTM